MRPIIHMRPIPQRITSTTPRTDTGHTTSRYEDEADKPQLNLQKDRNYTYNLKANLKTFMSNLHDYEESEDEVEDTEDEYEDESESETDP